MKVKRRKKIIIERRYDKRNVNMEYPMDFEANRTKQCTRRQRAIIYQAMEMGLPVKRAIDLAGVTKTQHNQWMKKGINKSSRRFYFYRLRINKYKLEREAEALNVIRQAQNGGGKIKETRIHIGGKYGREITRTTKTVAPKWGAAAWYLERIYPSQYALSVNNEDKEKDPLELAREIRQSLNAIDESVPME